MKPLSSKAHQIFDFINERSANGMVPTIREICTALNMKSTSTAHRYIAELVDAGWLEKLDNQRRAIRVKGYGAVKIPLVGIVTAGIPITAVENITDYISFCPDRNYNSDLFALKIRGDSMINAGILDGDIAVICQTPVANNGDIVVAMTPDDEATIKTFFKENGHFRLQPQNDSYEPIILDEISIVGKVISIIRYY